MDSVIMGGGVKPGTDVGVLVGEIFFFFLGVCP